MNTCLLCLRASARRFEEICDECEERIVIPARARGETGWRFGSFESHPCVYGDADDPRAFVLFVRSEGWRAMPYGEVFNKVGVMTRAKFDAYGDLPPLPK